MFNLDRWQEIFDAIRKNKLRTFLTGLSVASGIFILVILLGFGQGFQNGIRKEFEADATNRVVAWTQVTTKKHKGLNPGRSIRLNNDQYSHITTAFDNHLEYKSSRFGVGGEINYKEESGSYGIQGVSPDYQFIENMKMVSGRYLNQTDMDSNNKVVIISHKIRKELMKEVADPVGEYLQLAGINFKIVGVYADEGGEREENRVYIPTTTSQAVYNGQNTLDNIAFTLRPEASFDEAVVASKIFTKKLENYLKEVHSVAPDDERAVRVYSALEEAKRYYTISDNIAFFFWFVGICTIIAGVVGVSNVMLIIVKDRTREIGIRKALGAKPMAIVGMILHESIFVTSVAGFAGLIFSMGILEIVGPNVEVDYISNPSVNFSTAISMVFMLILAGALAGFFPAWKAAMIRPIEALRDE
jgi:putative ABC transport system permease protein